MTTEISQNVVRLLFGDGLIAHDELKWDIIKVVGSSTDFVTHCVLFGRTWSKLTAKEKSEYDGPQKFNAARSAKIQWLRKRLAQFKPSLTDIRFLEIPQKSFTPDEVAELLHISPSSLSGMINSPKGDRMLVKHVAAHHMPRRPMLIDILLNAPITLKEALDLIERHWRGWSPEHRAFMKIWSMPEMVSANFAQSRQTWSIHKLAVLEDLKIPNRPKRVQRVLRWPDVWAWRGLLCGQKLDETFGNDIHTLRVNIDKQQAKLDIVQSKILFALDKLG